MLTIDQIFDLEDLTRTLIADLKRAVADSAEDTAAIAPDVAIGRLSRLDAIQQQEMAKAGVRRHEQRIAGLEAALDRIDQGTYGMCSTCGQDIDFERLKIAPEVTECARCAAGDR